MIQIDPNDRIGGPQERKSSLTWLALSGMVALGLGLLFWFYFTTKNDFGAIYSQLGIKPLPTAAFEQQPQIRNQLERLGREPCYVDAVVELGEHLLKAGFPREAGTSLRTFARRCGNAADVLPLAYTAFGRINDYTSALEIADEPVRAAPSNGTARYWRAIAYERTGDFARALADYTSSLQLVGNPKNVVGDVFYKLSQTYVALGRYCDAITPIEMYISLDPADRRTPQTTSIIADFADKGKCDNRYASGTARVPFVKSDNVRVLTVTVNGVPGNLILDTGATFVSITSQFAARARVFADSDNHVTVKTVGGTTSVDTGYAESVSIGKAEARGVVVAMHRGNESPFGDKIDGLLGMSFLSRFNVSISPEAIELRAIPLR
jgi:tetratricopeptide (TPR) repeat protein